MRIIGIVALIVLATWPARAQSLPPINLWRDDKPPMSEEEKQRNQAIDKAYRSATDKIPKKSTPSDPWQSVRSGEQKQTKPAPRN
jgi:hypothetical protein